MVIFNSYVKLPEGSIETHDFLGSPTLWNPQMGPKHAKAKEYHLSDLSSGNWKSLEP